VRHPTGVALRRTDAASYVGDRGAPLALDQLELQDELDAQEGFDEWIRSLPCPPWAEEDAA
jgi:hypothetical protein